MSDYASPIDQKSRHPLVAKLELFSELSADDCATLEAVQRMNVRDVGPREDIIREGDTPNHVNLVLSGWACRYKQLPDGRRQVIGYFLPGDFCDLRVYILTEMDHSVAAVSPVKLAGVPRKVIDDLTNKESPLARAFWWSALVTEAIEREWIANLGLRSAPERMGHLFCELFLRLRAVGLTYGASCDLPLTQAELAETVGLSLVHVNRTLQDLRTRGLITLQGKTLTIPDLARLQRSSLFSANYLHLDRRRRERDASQF